MLNNIGLPGLLLIAVVVLVLFGRGKISSMMGEVGKGITAFKRGMDDGKREIEDATVLPPREAASTAATSTAAGVPPASVTHVSVPPAAAGSMAADPVRGERERQDQV
jgi:sec-independent protein translocase protein TatA